MIEIHKSAIVSNKAEIGEDVKVGPFVVIDDDVEIGEGTNIMQGVYIGDGARIGKNVTIHPHAVVSNVPQDIKFDKSLKTTAEVGDNTTIRECVTMHRGTEYHHKSTVGRNCFIMAYVHVAHDCLIGDNVIIANSTQMGGHCTIGNFVNIGGLTAIHQFSKIGDYAMVGGTSAVRKDIPPYALVSDHPIAFMKINIIGLKRRGFTPEQIQLIEKCYDTIYYSKLNITQALQRIKDTFEMTPEVMNIVSFIEGSKRGIVKGFKV